MKKFNLLVLVTEQFNVHVFAENFDLIDGSFVFICDNEIVCCYPINKTIIQSIENMDEE